MQRRRFPLRVSNRGVTLVEALVSMSILALGLVGITAMQLISARSNAMARRMSQASALATDLIENIGLWSYTDPRLASTEVVTSTSDPLIAARANLGQSALITSSANKPTYSEQDGSNALTTGALYNSTTQYDGYTSDVDGDGALDFERYWSVFNLDSVGDGLELGKLVVVTVRWNEPPLGYRQISMSTFIANSGNFGQ